MGGFRITFAHSWIRCRAFGCWFCVKSGFQGRITGIIAEILLGTSQLSFFGEFTLYKQPLFGILPHGIQTYLDVQLVRYYPYLYTKYHHLFLSAAVLSVRQGALDCQGLQEKPSPCRESYSGNQATAAAMGYSDGLGFPQKSSSRMETDSGFVFDVL